MPQRSRQSSAAPPDPAWKANGPQWVAAIAAAAGVLVTAGLGIAGLANRDPEITPGPSIVAEASAASGSAGAAGPGGAGPAATEVSLPPPDVDIETYGWTAPTELVVEGMVAGISGPLWIAVQPITTPGSDDWHATQMKFTVGDDWASPRPFSATFDDLPRFERVRFKVFQSGLGFGASGGPGLNDFGLYLEGGGAMRPSEILDVELDVPVSGG
jgi:hypothetical protein